jgi:hypothetical protein
MVQAVEDLSSIPRTASPQKKTKRKTGFMLAQVQKLLKSLELIFP